MWFPIEFEMLEAGYPAQIGVTTQNGVGKNCMPFSMHLQGTPRRGI